MRSAKHTVGVVQPDAVLEPEVSVLGLGGYEREVSGSLADRDVIADEAPPWAHALDASGTACLTMAHSRSAIARISG